MTKKPIAKIIYKNRTYQELVKTLTSLDELEFPSELRNCIKLQNFAENSSGKTHKIAAIVTVITVASASTAGKIYTATNAPTSIYTVLILRTGAGKDILTKIPAKIIPSFVEIGNVTSLGAIEDLVFRSPAITHINDEYGDLLDSMLSEGNSAKKEIFGINQVTKRKVHIKFSQL